ncbi:MAG: bifunctional DNA-formamidopyrimidine glycosylase/DNA-(apurinic or apyrimidinic site) lyase [Zoogloeaceae bacterium]|jgi:formamidopyrimidine-DNA glycosylase|nr:bifunctional DNA-formamidopyrimidine glycosylase/DNA-(apurinic or apyrimidinic site) lyase [Zoogloeaceae bacterium]
MPELPEVEVSRLGLLPLAGRSLLRLVVRESRLRRPIPPDLGERLFSGIRLESVARRGKYLLFHWPEARGWLILHLGMSGSVRILEDMERAPGKHDHVDFVFSENTLLRFRDPRRFGLLEWQSGENPLAHPLLAPLGIEPLSENFTADWLAKAVKGRRIPVKPFLMDSRRVVGVGNIYASESLFRAGIAPFCPAGSLSRARLERLTRAVQEVLQEAIAAGGSSLRDYVRSDGGAGSFQLSCAVYGRAAMPCPRCKTPIAEIRQNGRASFYCPRCQS